MIKVPGTRESPAAIEQLTAEGVNVNVTLLFGLGAYRQSAEAYLAGLERWAAGGGDPGRVAGVASFFLSRIDAVVDERLNRALATEPDGPRRTRLGGLIGKVAIANARLAYVHYQQLIASPRWRALAARGAHPQRLLWASTGPKDPSLSRTHYVDPLIGPDTVNTVTAETWKAFVETGRPALTLTTGVEEARQTLQALADVGISLDEVTDGLVDKGVQAFCRSFDNVLAALDRQARALAAAQPAAAPP
jgi:transaldolase/glucose-6-phosphate isomerase